MKKFLILLSLLLCLSVAATAETISFSGTVKASDTVNVYAPIGGTVEKVYVSAGDTVTANTVLAKLKTEKVYATEDGTVTAVFGEPGDNAESIASRYGALIYMESSIYTISGSTEYAYNAVENVLVHVGEEVYIKSRTTSSHVGTGLVTAVSGTSFTVEVNSGDFLLSESCEIFRSEDYATSSRIGRGSTSRKAPSTVSASGSIVNYAVKAGDTVKKGDLLLETLTGSFDGYYMSGTELYAGVAGVISQLNLSAGNAVQKDAAVATIYPAGAMEVEASVAEADLSYVHVGDKVTVELTWNQDQDVSYVGTITAISAVASEEGESVSYPVTISFTPDENTRYGMTAVITTEEGTDAQ